MRFIVDECTGPGVSKWLKAKGFEVCCVYKEMPGTTDEAIIRKAFHEHWIIITNDKDFGEKIFREGYEHHGVILLRLEDERTVTKIDVLEQFLNSYRNKIKDAFVTITEKIVRFARCR